jgi:hypothetical protein
MQVLIGLLAASILGAEGPRAADSPMITYEIKLLEMNGLNWRAAHYSQLNAVSRQGSATVWTAPKDVASRITEQSARIVAAPKVTAFSQARATIFQNKTRNVVTEMSRQADGPVNHASYVGYTPKVENATEGWSAMLSGRKLDQGVLATVVLEDKQITAVHPVSLTEVLEKKGEKDEGKGDGEDSVRIAIQVPEIARAEVSGEWLIPNDGVLLVSFGAHTVADAKGKAVVLERLAVIEAKPVPADKPTLTMATTGATIIGPPGAPIINPRGVEARSFWPDLPTATTGTSIVNDTIVRSFTASMRAKAIPLPLPHAAAYGPDRIPTRAEGIPLPLPAPLVPSRGFPQALNASGQPVPLPTLPEDHTPPTALPGSSEPCATPQSKSGPVGDPIPPKNAARRDSNSVRAGYTTEPAVCEDDCKECPAGKTATTSAWTPSQIKPFSFRVPVNGNITIEVRALATPVPSASVPPPPAVRPSK